MVTRAKEDAFRLFQVINDRGTSLTEGDLLRAKTLEILEEFSSEQNSVEDLWDKILSDPLIKLQTIFIRFMNQIMEKERHKMLYLIILLMLFFRNIRTQA